MLKKIDVAVVGAGPAGLMAAIGVALAGRTVEVYEKNDIIGKKLLITGKGRCNVTNDCSVQDMVEAFAPNGRFLYSALHGFDVQDTMGFFEKLGVNLKVERGRRVFPSSDCAKDVRDAMVRYARKLGVVFSTDSAVQNLKSEDGRVVGLVTKNGVYVDVGAVVVATGGASYPLTGSTGDGYEMAKAFGHTIIDLLPALVPGAVPTVGSQHSSYILPSAQRLGTAPPTWGCWRPLCTHTWGCHGGSRPRPA